MFGSQRGTPGASPSKGAPASSSGATRISPVPKPAGTPSRDSARGHEGAPAGTPASGTSHRSHGTHNSALGAHGSHSAHGSGARAAAAEATGGGGSPELLAQLRERLQQLEAEVKASSDTAQWTIKQNKNTLLTLKQENKELAAEVSRRGGSNELQGSKGPTGDGEKAVERLERLVHEHRRAYDRIVKEKKTALQKLDNLHDSLRDLAKVAAMSLPGTASPSASAPGSAAASLTSSLASTAAASAVTAAAAAAAAGSSGGSGADPGSAAAARELRQLQNRLDKATVRANEAFSIRKTYEQVLEKLRVEEPLLEARIRALEEQRAAKQLAVQTATLAGRETAAARDAAKAALAALEEEVARERARRERALGEMREKAATLQTTNRALLQRQFQPIAGSSALPTSASAASLPNPSASSSSQPFPPSSAAPSAAAPALSASAASLAAVLSAEGDDLTARDLVVRLCGAVGCRTVGELLARLGAQQESHAGLVAMRAAAGAQRLALTQQVELLRSHAAELRGGGGMSTQRQLDAAQAELADASARSEAASAALDSALRAWAGVRGGLEHLSALVAPLPPPPGAHGAPLPAEEELLGEVLAQIEQRLCGAFRVIAAMPRARDMLEAHYAGLLGGGEAGEGAGAEPAAA